MIQKCKLRYALFSLSGYELELSKKVSLSSLKKLGLLKICRVEYLNDPIRMEEMVLWKDENVNTILKEFDRYFIDAGFKEVPKLQGALFLLPQDPFVIDEIFCEISKLLDEDCKFSHYTCEKKLLLHNTQFIDSRYMSLNLSILDNLDEDANKHSKRKMNV